jgi:predicted O-methyltransferase YrrM
MKTPRWLRRVVTGRRWPSLDRQLITLRDLAALQQAMDWPQDPVLTDSHLHEYHYPEDANRRRLRDGEVIGCACRNAGRSRILEIGTSLGETTKLMARNAPMATIHTVNIPPEEISTGGTLTTHAPSREEIGSSYRQAGFKNVEQIFANTATWEPGMKSIDVAFIDGCHDYRYVINDTKKVLRLCRPGSVILWHDFNPALAYRFPWIGEVVTAIDHLVQTGIIHGPIFHLQDSWTGLYRIQ